MVGTPDICNALAMVFGCPVMDFTYISLEASEIM